MKILVINGDCLQTNSSANLCHLAYIRGLLDAGHAVTVLSADGKDYKLDAAMEIPKEARSYTYYGVSFYEKLSLRKQQDAADVIQTESNDDIGVVGLKQYVVQKAKETILRFYGVHGIYATFVKKAQAFRSEEQFDYVLSLSTPVTSHLLTHNLLKAGHIKANHWIQIWEDPWYSDTYGFNGKEKIRREEERLLSFADKVCYVSPLTLENQQRLFPKYAHKMFWQPLPFYYKAERTGKRSSESNQYGYFGNYIPASRDLKPFYEAANVAGIPVAICGYPSNLFTTTETVKVYPRLPLGELKPLEDATNVLVFLCNRQGGQIPGKIYQYAATDKTILFILDGTEHEQEVLKEFFGQYDRFVFCQNTPEDILRAIRAIESGDLGDVKNEPLDAFNPLKTINRILELGGA